MSSFPQNANGSATSANSSPVVIASDQATVPVSLASVPSHAVTNAGTFAVQAASTLAAETTKVIGVVRAADGSGNLLTSTTNALDINIKSGNPTSITANAGTNLNTSALALETGGNLATIATRTPALGQALAAASVPVILPSATVTTLTPPAAITGFALDATLTGGTARTKITDGTNNAAVKAASTAAAATDPALVVAISPNNTVPVSLASVPSHAVTQATGTNLHTVVDSGTITANQGTAASTTAGWPVINGESADTTGTITTATGTVVASGLIGYANTTVSVNGTYAGLVAIWEGSDDSGVTYYPITAAREGVPPVMETTVTLATNASQSWQINNPGLDSIRLRATALTSGTVNVRISASASPTASGTTIGIGYALPTGANVIGALTANQSVNNAQINGVTPLMGNGVTGTGSQRVTIASDNTAFSVNATASQATGSNLHMVVDSGTVTTVSAVTTITNALPAGTNLMGKVGIDQTTPGTTNGVTSVPATSGGLSVYHLASAATTNLQVPKASAGQLYGYMVSNTSAAYSYLCFHNASTTPTAGASIFFKIGIPAGGAANVNFDNGIPFSTGIAISTVTGAADNNTTAVALNDLIINLFYK